MNRNQINLLSYMKEDDFKDKTIFEIIYNAGKIPVGIVDFNLRDLSNKEQLEVINAFCEDVEKGERIKGDK